MTLPSVKKFPPEKLTVATTHTLLLMFAWRFLSSSLVPAGIFHLLQIISSFSSFSRASTGIVTDPCPGMVTRSRVLNSSPSAVTSLELGLRVS